MANELMTELEFWLEDVVGGQPLNVVTVDLPTLRGFLEKVETLIKGAPGASIADSRAVKVEDVRPMVRCSAEHRLLPV